MFEVPTGPTAASAIAAVSLVALAALAWRRPQLRGTTLVAPWYWSLASLAALAASEVLISLVADGTSAWVMPLRFAAACGTLCPAMALFGAKRPQDRPWQFIVLSLWGILSLPSGEWLLFGGVQEMHPARLVFLTILVGASAINGIATRYWPSSILFAAGQLLLLAPFLANASTTSNSQAGPLTALIALTAAWWLQAIQFPRAAKAREPLDRVWIDFRDEFGLVWGRRVADRINTSAAMYDWPVKLTWRGFRPRGPEPATAESIPAIEDSLRTLLRRFVSPEWIDRRLA